MSMVQHKYLIIDTSILCVWLKVPNFETCGPDNNRWDYDRVNAKINEELGRGTYFVLPLASIIETGNHITHIRGDRHCYAAALVDIINSTVNKESPWLAFSIQNDLWNSNGLKLLAERWLKNVDILSIGDVSIVNVAEYCSHLGEVEIFSGDQGLVAHQPQHASYIPRRRQ